MDDTAPLVDPGTDWRWQAPPGWPAPPSGWRPNPGWRPDPHWPLPPPDWQWWVRDAPALPAPTTSVGERTRRSIVTEMVVVAALVWLPWVVDGVIGLAQGVGGQTLPALPVIVAGHRVVSAVALSLELSLNVTGVLLVWYVLAQSGESLATIGLYRRVTGRDAGAGLLLLAALFGITLVVGAAVDAAQLPNYGYGASGHLPAYFLIPGWLGALAAGLSEEILVVGYLLHRLDQLGVPKRRAVLISAVARASYHVYYGFGALIMLAVGVLFAWRWQRSRRLWRLIGAHAAWDLILSVFTVV